MTYKSHDLRVTWPAGHITCESHDLKVTQPASQMTCKPNDLQVTWPESLITASQQPLSPCLIQGGSGHWESSLMGHSTFPTWVKPLVVRTTDWEERSSHYEQSYISLLVITWHDITVAEHWTYVIPLHSISTLPGEFIYHSQILRFSHWKSLASKRSLVHLE